MSIEFGALISSVKAAYDIAQGATKLKNEVDRNLAVSGILTALLDVQKIALEMQEKAHALELEKLELAKKNQEQDNWAQVEKRYELTELSKGLFVYGYKKIEGNFENYHILCPNCFSKKHKSLLQNHGVTHMGIMYKCHACESEIYDPSEKLSLKRMVISPGIRDERW